MRPDRPIAPIRYVVDPAIADLVPRYLARCRNSAIRVREHLSRDETEAVKLIGSDLAGSGLSFGFPPITEIGLTIVRCASTADHAGMLDAAEWLEHYLDALTPESPGSVARGPGPAGREST